MSTLADRYVWGVLRAVPERQRADLEPEIRALIADAVEAREASSLGDASAPGDAASAGDAAPGDAAAVERAVLTELGDPELLAARYTDRSLYLVGPSYYLDYRRLLGLLLTIVVPIVTLATMFAGFIAGISITQVALNGVYAGLSVGVQLAFWVTLVFALVEGRGTRKAAPLMAWSPDRLPSVPSSSRLGAGEAVVSVLASVFVIGVIVWQPPFYIDGRTVPFFDPALAGSWLAWFLVVAVVEIGFTIAAYAARRWTWTFAVINAVLAAAFAIPAVWLLQAGRVLSPEAVAEMERIGAGAALAPTAAVAAMAIVVIAGWDALDGFLKARRTAGGR
jgi:hypothetical protein